MIRVTLAIIRENPVLLRVGYDFTYACPQPTPMILMLNIHFSRVSDIVVPDHLIVSPSVPVSGYRDMFGNWCMRIVAPAGLAKRLADPAFWQVPWQDVTFQDQ